MERNPEIVEQLATEKVSEWFNTGSFYIASTSDAKINALAALGIDRDRIHPLASTDAAEKAKFQDYQEYFSPNWVDIYRTYSAELVARNKLDEVSDQIADDAFAIALDTVPEIRIPNPNFFTEKGQKFFINETFNKPKNKDEARKMIHQTFLRIIVGRFRVQFGFERFKHFLQESGKNKELEAINSDEETKEIYQEMFGVAQQCVSVKTGIAMRFPHEEDIVSTTAENQVYLDTILQLADRAEGAEITMNQVRNQGVTDQMHKTILSHFDSEEFKETVLSTKTVDGKNIREELDKIIDEVIVIMGDNLLRVSGGIDFSNPKIRELLQISERNSPYLADPEEGTYTGFPQNAVLNMFQKKALNSL